MAVDHKLIGFIQTEHNKTYFVGGKGNNNLATGKYVLYGMVTTYWKALNRRNLSLVTWASRKSKTSYFAFQRDRSCLPK